MSITQTLLDTAHADTELLVKNDSLGDDFTVPRDVDFLFRTDSEETADTVCSFVNDCRYGVARVERSDGEFRVLVVVHMPTTQNVACSVSGLMACIGQLFGVAYDGWGCSLKRKA